MLLSCYSPAFVALFYDISLVQRYQAVASRYNIATVISADRILSPNNDNGNMLSSNDNKACLNINTEGISDVENYFKGLIENLNYLRNHTKFESHELPDSRTFERLTQLKRSNILKDEYYARLGGVAYCNDANLKA
ncbi:hypothetical protein K502DRAFT_350167 [Neoconidiobolus thromboides FSU 785]|nr:hypothetical protein K502DRAFT_350167 [Neoconidiobolus thromboides FSU 785]